VIARFGVVGHATLEKNDDRDATFLETLQLSVGGGTCPAFVRPWVVWSVICSASNSLHDVLCRSSSSSCSGGGGGGVASLIGGALLPPAGTRRRGDLTPRPLTSDR